MTAVMEWATRAACGGMDTDLWFPDPGGSIAAAVAICGRCPVQQECLDYAAARPALVGVWGGLTDRQRRGRRKPQGPLKTCVQCGARVPMSGLYCSRDCGRAATCGTAAGYRQHRAHAEDACEPCLEAHRIEGRAHDRARRQRERERKSEAAA